MDEFLSKFASIKKYFSSGFTFFVEKIKEAVSELKEVDTILTEISKTNEKLSKSDLDGIKDKAFEVAGKYGRKASDYLTSVKEASSSGYDNAADIAELSMAAQSAGGMTAELANQMILTTDKAYNLNGSVSELTKTLDGINAITNQNTVNMADFSEAMSIVGSTAASFGVQADETAAAIGTMAEKTQQSGEDAARAFKTILLNIRQVADEEEGITAEGITKYEQACNDLGVSLKETKNGILALRDPMDVLKELSDAYNKLGKGNEKKANLLDAIGGGTNSAQLDALLSQWGTYEAMLRQYADGSGSMAAEAEQTANSWEGSLNRLSNTWTATVANVVNSDGMATAANGLNGVLSVINAITDKLGALETVGLGAGLFAGLKNVGGDHMHSSNYICFE